MNKILTEIRQTRDDLAQGSGYDLQRLFDYVRAREREAAARGVKFVAPPSPELETTRTLREEPPGKK
jgi:hypothetical protein